MNRWRLRGPLLLTVTALVATACSAAVVVSETSSTTTLQFVTTTTPEVALSDLVGDWDNGQLFLQIADDGSYQALETANSDPNDPLMGGFVARDGADLNFVTDIYGECAGQTGVYEAAMSDGQLVLTMVDDPCVFRATRFEGPFERSG